MNFLKNLFNSDGPHLERLKIKENFDLIDAFMFIGSTTINEKLNLTGGTITGNLNIEGNFTGNTLYSGSTLIDSLFARTSHLHIISDVDGLQTHLDNKSDLSGATFIGDIVVPTLTATTLYSGSTLLDSLFARTSHTHVVANITGLQTSLNNKADLSGATFTGNVNILTNLISSAIITSALTASTITASGLTITNSGSRFTIDNSGNTQISGSISLPYTAQTTTYSIKNTDHTIDCTSGTFTVTLPTAVGIQGKIYVIKNSGTGTITVATTSSQTIDGTTTKIISVQYDKITVQSNGTNWIII